MPNPHLCVLCVLLRPIQLSVLGSFRRAPEQAPPDFVDLRGLVQLPPFSKSSPAPGPPTDHLDAKSSSLRSLRSFAANSIVSVRFIPARPRTCAAGFR